MRCNQNEAQQLAQLPQLQQEIAAKKLVVWPWICPGQYHTSNSHPAHTPQPYFWQVPRNQLALLAGYGRNLKLAYFDLDEYLVLPAGSTLCTVDCNGRPLLDQHSTAVWSLARYAALCTNCSGEELTCWEQANKQVYSDHEPAALEGVQGSGSATSAGLANHRTMLQGLKADWGPMLGLLQVNQCPCMLGKAIVHPAQVDNTKVHKTTPVQGYRTQTVDYQCGYLLHLQALISSKRPWDRSWDRMRKNKMLICGQWVVGDGVLGSFVTEVGSPSMLTTKQCLLKGSELPRRCLQS